MEHLGDDLPAAVEFDEGQQIREEFRPDGAFDPGQRGHRPGKFDREDPVVAAGRRLALVDDGKYSSMPSLSSLPSVALA